MMRKYLAIIGALLVGGLGIVTASQLVHAIRVFN
jgi:hypothetical protein